MSSSILRDISLIDALYFEYLIVKSRNVLQNLTENFHYNILGEISLFSN